jgi:predicted PurR-regulated permease PerM
MTLYSPQQRKSIIVLITVALGLFLLWELKGLISAFLGAVVMYVLFRPLFGWFIINAHFPKWVSALTVILISFLLLVLPFLVVGLMIGDKVQDLLTHTDEINRVVQQVQNFLGYNNAQSANSINELILSARGELFGGVSFVLSGIGDLLLTIAMMYLMLWFMLMRHASFEHSLVQFMPFTRKETELFALELKSSTYGNVLGQGLICLVQAFIMGIGFNLFGLQDAFFWAVITFFISFLPFLGAPLVFVPAGLIALSSGNSSAGYGIMLWGFLLVTNIDNLLRFFISKYFADTHPLITIIGVIAGVPVFGILGLVFGPLLISWFVLLTKIILTERNTI